MSGVIIGKGKLFRVGFEKHGVHVPGLTFQVRNLAGVPCEHDYTGPGFDNGERLMLGAADSCSLAEYSVDVEATRESVDARNGALARIAQARATFPKNANDAWRDGWQDADRQLRDETKAARVARLAAR